MARRGVCAAASIRSTAQGSEAIERRSELFRLNCSEVIEDKLSRSFESMEMGGYMIQGSRLIVQIFSNAR